MAYAGLWALTVAFAAVVWAIPGGSGFARGALVLSLSAARNPAPSVAAAVSITANNALHAGWPLALGPIGAARRRAARAFVDVAVALNIAMCAVLVGSAIGGYGSRTVAFLPQVPLEWAGVAVGAAGWTVERSWPLRRHERAVAAGVLVGLLAVAAAIEVWVTPHR